MSELTALLETLKGSYVRPGTTRPTSLGDSENIPLDDTTGWAQLESALRQVYTYILSLQPEKFNEILSEYVIQLCICDPSIHMSRHVRQSCLEFIEQLLDRFFKSANNIFKVNLQVSIPLNSTSSNNASNNSTSIYRYLFDSMYNAISNGLHDNWSEIRLVACHAARSFLLALSEFNQSFYWPKLLPRLCMSRFYAAEGVKVYSIETWKLIIKTRGKLLITKYIEYIISHYIDMSQAKNHMVSEAANLAISEIVGKIDSSVVRPYISRLLEVTKGCLLETSWPVRDAACCGTGLFIKNYPEESKPYMELFTSIWTRQLNDSIWSVRENAAFAIGDSLTTSDQTLRRCIFDFVTDYLSRHINQVNEEMSKEDSKKSKISSFLPMEMLVTAASTSSNNMSKTVPTLNSSTTTTTTTDAVQSESQPGQQKKVWRTGGGWGCCLDCVIERKQSPWESSAGCVVLVRELIRAASDLTTDPFAVEKYPHSSLISSATASATNSNSNTTSSCVHKTTSPLTSGSTNIDTTSSDSIQTVDSELLLHLGVSYIESIWSLLTVSHFPDAYKLQLLVLQQLPEVYRNWASTAGRVTPSLSQSITADRVAIVNKLPSCTTGAGKYAVIAAVDEFHMKMSVYMSQQT